MIRAGAAVWIAVAWAAVGLAAEEADEAALMSVSLADPHIADDRDLALVVRAWQIARTIVRSPAAEGSAELAPYGQELRAHLRREWARAGPVARWIWEARRRTCSPPLVVIDSPSEAVSDFLAARARETQDYLHTSFGLPRPRWCLIVRLVRAPSDLPRPLRQIFDTYEHAARVTGVTVPPRFVIIPLRRPGIAPFAIDARELVNGRGVIKSPLAFRELVVHEAVHASVGAVLAEAGGGLASATQRWSELPAWFHEGLAVYVTEKLRIEPGSKPLAYYQYSAPLHYLEEDWGADTLREFVRRAVTRGMPAALDLIGMDEQALLEHGEEFIGRPPPMSHALRALLYLFGFLASVLALVSVPFVAARLVRLFRHRLLPSTSRELDRLWQQIVSAPDRASREKAAMEFIKRLRRAPPAVRGAMASRRMKVFLMVRR